jgi:pilus assembly protein CpaF
MVQKGTLSIQQRSVLEASVKQKKNILLAGATSSGKTTLVRALAESVCPQERIVVLEDVPELRIAHPHCVYLQTIEAGQGESLRPMSLDDLLREALRMRPDRLIVGECRGHEAFALIQALHTGHRGSFSTLHANSAIDALRRLEALLVRAEPSLSESVVRNLIAGAFDVIVFMERTPDMQRYVSGVHQVEDLLC